MKLLALEKVYQLLEPGPVVLLTTAQSGKANVMTMSWHTMMDFVPPLVGCVVSENNYSFTALRRTKQCVIAIPPAQMARKVVGIGNTSGRDIDKFRRFRLEPQPAQAVAAPLIADCFANLECRVVDTRLVNTFNLFVLEVVQAWSDFAGKPPKTLHHCGYGRFIVDGREIRLKSAKA